MKAIKIKSLAVDATAFSFSATVDLPDEESIFITFANERKGNRLVVIQGKALICNVIDVATEIPYPIVISESLMPKELFWLMFGKDAIEDVRNITMTMAVYQSSQHINRELEKIYAHINPESGLENEEAHPSPVLH